MSYRTHHIDWKDQWKSFSKYYRDGYVFIDLSKFGNTTPTQLKLTPGPGFGDLSHPTTRLMLSFMIDHVKDKDVVDIGCGSGVLSIAAKVLAPKSVHGIDIDLAALEHAKKNSTLNHMSICFGTAESYIKKGKTPLLILMNMISSEQQLAWDSLPQLHKKTAEIIVSGILKENREDYIKLQKLKNWVFLEDKEEEGWLAMRFTQLGSA